MNLVNYVANTPQNTNKTILKQLVNDEKNKAVYESVGELKKSGGAGYTETKRTVFTYDGNGEKIDLHGDGSMYIVKVSNECFDHTAIKSIKSYYGNLDKTITLKEGQFMATELGGAIFVQTELSEDPVILACAEETQGLPKGTYFQHNDHFFVCELVTEDETIHPIDPKFLPDVCLPVVELETVLDLTTEATTELTTAEKEQLSAAEEAMQPIVFSFKDTNGGINKFVMPLKYYMNQAIWQGVFIMNAIITVTRNTGEWCVWVLPVG